MASCPFPTLASFNPQTHTQTQTSKTPVVSSVFILGSCKARTEDFLFILPLKECSRETKKSLSCLFFSALFLEIYFNNEIETLAPKAKGQILKPNELYTC